MATPILEQIMQKIAIAVEAVTTANGYQIDVNSCYRPKNAAGIFRTPPKNYVVQLMLGDATKNDELNVSSNPPRITWDQQISLDLIYKPSDTSETPLDAALIEFAADITKGVFVDPLWAGLASDTNIIGVEPMDGDQSSIVRLTIAVRYRVKENNPYEQ